MTGETSGIRGGDLRSLEERRSLCPIDQDIPIGKTGRIVSGWKIGRFVRVEQDGDHFIVINSPKRQFVHGEIYDEVWDDWVENEADLRGYFDGREWVIEWLD